MIKQVHEDVSIDRAGLEEILKLHIERTERIDRASTRTHFEVGSRSGGHGYGEYDYAVFKEAKVETITPTSHDDVLKVLGRRTFRFNEQELKAVVLAYVADARKVDRSNVVVELKLQDRHQGDRGGWEGPGITGATVTIKIA